MALEYCANFDTKDEAVNFQRFLKTISVSSKIETKCDGNSEIVYLGKYSDFAALITDLRKSLYEYESVEREAIETSINYLEKDLTNRQKQIADVYAKYPEGEFFSLDAIMEERRNFLNFTEEQKERYDKCCAEEFALLVLVKNGAAMFDEDSKEWVILDKIDVSEITDDFNLDGFGFHDDEKFRSFGLMKVVNFYGECFYTVVSSPTIVLADFEKIREYYKEVRYVLAEEEEEEFEMLYYQNVLVMRILRCINAGISTFDELKGYATSIGPMEKKSMSGSLLKTYVEDDFLKEVLGDLKNVGAIVYKKGCFEVTKKFAAILDDR